MNSLLRFLSLGMQDADRRVSATLTPHSLDGADRYLKQGAIISRVDRLFERLHEWWAASETGRLVGTAAATFERDNWPQRYQAIAIVLIVAVVTHLLLTLLQGMPPGWFWMIIPAVVLVFASTLLAASSSSHR